jgi:membrane protein DedA with SNARE-associated domain
VTLQTTETLGYVGIAGLVAAENLLPPIPSEVILPLSGSSVAQGSLHAYAIIAPLVFFIGRFIWLRWRAGKPQIADTAKPAWPKDDPAGRTPTW